ncbi:unnamed protein product, partial [Rotaria sordida]
RSSTETHGEPFEREIQQQRKLIENFNFEMRELEAKFEKERYELEQERDSEREKNVELQNTLHLANRRFTELQTEYERLQPIAGEQRDKYEQQIRTYQSQIAQIDQVRKYHYSPKKNIKEKNFSVIY